MNPKTCTNLYDDKHVKPWLQVWWILHEEHRVQAHVQAASLPPNPNFAMDFHGLSNFKTLGPWTRSRHMISKNSSNSDHNASLRKRGNYWLEKCFPEASQSWTGRCFSGCASSMRRSRTGIRVWVHLARRNLLMTCLKYPQVALVFNPAVALRSYTSDPTTVHSFWFLTVSVPTWRRAARLSDTILQSECQWCKCKAPKF